MDRHACGQILGYGVLEASGLKQRLDTHRIVGPNEHRRPAPVGCALQQRVEKELLGLGGAGDEATVVAVDLRTDDERDVGVAEVPE